MNNGLLSNEELLARFIIRRDWLRADRSIKPDAFMPPRDLHLSVTRHDGLSEEQLRAAGQRVADEIADQENTPYFGRADVVVSQIPASLQAVPFPVPGNDCHVHIDGWPQEKSEQKGLALTLAAAARVVVSI